MHKVLLTLAFFIMIWDADVIVVRWEDQPAGETSVLCTVTDNFGTAETLELEQFTWTNNNRDGEWRIYHNFNGRSWFANCLGHVDGVPVTVTASGFASFPLPYQLFMPVAGSW